MNKVENLFKDKALVRGSVMLLSKNDAIEFIQQCEKEGIRILGVDGFLLIGDRIQPSLENSRDFTTQNAMNKSIFKDAFDFVHSVDGKFFFEITCY